VTARFLLDTGIVSAPIAARPDRTVVQRLGHHGHECAIAAPVWHELVYGCQRLPHGGRRRALEDYLRGVVLRSFPVLPYDEAAAACHARERARLEAVGRTPPFVDGQIAAIAMCNDLTLVTKNPRDFAAFNKLRVIDWAPRAPE
jgi:tRNA(fMet)-specific endonuclease VapC